MVEPLNNNSYDAIIIGQGLAGSLLAWEMIQHGIRVHVIDNHHHASASKVAAGIINPITGHRFNLTEQYSEFLDVARKTYVDIRHNLPNSDDFFFDIQQQRLIKNPGQRKYFEQRLMQESYAGFLTSPELDHANSADSFFSNPTHGIAEIKQSYHVDTSVLLCTLKTWLLQQQALTNTVLSYEHLFFNNNHVQYHQDNIHIQADNIIFCEGFQAINNPWLTNLPFKLAKGDILTIETQKQCEKLLNWGQWLLPSQQQPFQARLGSSYIWNDLSLVAEPNSAEKLLFSLKKNSNIQAKVIEHHTGIRPTTINRKPLIGFHPDINNLYCFNGFGSKGCLSIPYYAKLFSRHFSQNMPLDRVFPTLSPVLAI